MKQFKLIFLLLLIFFYSTSFGQSSKPKKQLGLIVKADVTFPIFCYFQNKKHHSSVHDYTKFSYFSGALEKQLKDRHSFQLTGVYYAENEIHIGQYPSDYLENANYILIVPEYKFFVIKHKPITGPYIGLYIVFQDEHITATEYGYIKHYYMFTELGGGLSSGYQFYIKNRIVIDVHAGFGLKKLIAGKSSPYHPAADGDGQLAINIGYKF